MGREFNASQKEAIEHFLGPALVLAGPGSGKTTVITYRIKNLIEKHNVRPQDILVITFTRLAAEEMASRFSILTSNKYMEVTFGTFHSIFFKILKHSYDFNSSNLIKDNEKYEIIRDIISGFDIQTNDENDLIMRILSEIAKVKNSKIDLCDYVSHSLKKEYFDIAYCKYAKRLEINGKIDFDDMLTMCHELFLKDKMELHKWQEKFQYVLIDECQDINRVQMDTILLLCQNKMNIFMVGDDDQSIYGFRGSSPEIMREMEEKYETKVIHLSVNYRSTSNIVLAAGQVINRNTNRFQKDIKTINEPGCKVHIKEFATVKDENSYVIEQIMKLISEDVNLSEIAILVRTNDTGRQIIAKLDEYNIPFKTREGIKNIFVHWACRDVFAYINIANGSQLRKDYLRIINKPQRFISRHSMENEAVEISEILDYYKDKTWLFKRVQRLDEDLKVLRGMSPFASMNYVRKVIGYDNYVKEYCIERSISIKSVMEILDEVQQSSSGFMEFYQWKEYINDFTKKINSKELGKSKEGISVATLHGCKGLEFEHVYILDVNEGVIPYNKAVFDSEIEEERRMFYVAMTRAKLKLTITYTDRRYNKCLPMSRFINDINENVEYDLIKKDCK